MSSDSDVISHFSPLDELIQVIYQGSARFVILSSVDDASWMVHVGLTGNEGRWWRGRWTDKDVKKQFGSSVSSFLLESAVEKMADTFVQGQVTIGDWSPSKGANIELVLGTSAKTPIRVQLAELDPAEAAAYATKVFTEIALQAQSRRCRLHPSTSAYESSKVDALAAGTSSSRKTASRRTPSPEPAPRTKHSSPHKTKDKGKDKEDSRPAVENRYKRKAEEAEEQIEALKAELEKTKRKQDAIMTEPSKLLPRSKVAAVTRPKGASLANPAKKARKYQALEFEDDE
ncbi:hypothetical protein L226DRAFT_558303 [Lentinus tigrinus ALCF2SS1-7]|uniref:uncharacterized protein n=1 Tax=Lentinus tigrinus ALCF2SS1-7 TaxID=1328758 RepID=UPI0011664001|nr:hypothetical protein L226DRAFT_558303 [Lentinus tigrinus ALCF2SS1-7]